MPFFFSFRIRVKKEIATPQITVQQEAAGPRLHLVEGSVDSETEEVALQLHPVEQVADEVKFCT